VLGLLTALYVIAGLVHAPELDAQRAAFNAQSDAVQRWVEANGNEFAQAHVNLADSIRIDDDLYRTCIPRPDPRRYLCLVVDTSRTPPRVTPDGDREPNASLNSRGASGERP